MSAVLRDAWIKQARLLHVSTRMVTSVVATLFRGSSKRGCFMSRQHRQARALSAGQAHEVDQASEAASCLDVVDGGAKERALFAWIKQARLLHASTSLTHSAGGSAALRWIKQARLLHASTRSSSLTSVVAKRMDQASEAASCLDLRNHVITRHPRARMDQASEAASCLDELRRRPIFAAPTCRSSKRRGMTMALKTTKKTSSRERYVLVTTAHRGVFAGYATDVDGETITLRSGRLCVYWSRDVKGFMGLAANGPTSGCRIGPAADITLRNITSVVAITDAARAAWEAAPWSS